MENNKDFKVTLDTSAYDKMASIHFKEFANLNFK